jgi:uncharacterized membrane protein
VGLVSSGLVSILLIGGLKSFFIVLPALGLQNWLVVLFRINVGQLGSDSLRILNPIDFAMLVLVGLTFLGLWPLLARGHKIWISLAVALFHIGIALLLITHLAGRSAVMGASLIVSFLMLRTPGFKKAAYLGIPANGLLLVGDFATTGSRTPVVALALAAGYVLLLAWFVCIAVSLWRRQRHT